MSACEYVYNLLTLGQSLEQSIDGDKKSYTLPIHRLEHPTNNAFHVTEEYSVMRTGSKSTIARILYWSLMVFHMHHRV